MEQPRSPLALLLLGFLFLVVVIFAAVGLVAIIGWWSGWTTLASFQAGIQIAGLLVLVGGVFGAVKKISIFKEEPSRLDLRVQEGGKPGLRGILRQYSFALVMLLGGLICLAIGWLL